MYILQEKITPKGAKIVLETDMSSALFGYNELRDTFYGLCRRFIELGYKGKRIAVIGKNCYEWVVCYLAAASVGIVVP